MHPPNRLLQQPKILRLWILRSVIGPSPLASFNKVWVLFWELHFLVPWLLFLFSQRMESHGETQFFSSNNNRGTFHVGQRHIMNGDSHLWLETALSGKKDGTVREISFFFLFWKNFLARVAFQIDLNIVFKNKGVK